MGCDFMRFVFIACAVCFKDPASPLSKGIGPAVAVLLGVALAVELAGVITAAVWMRRARRLEKASGS